MTLLIALGVLAYAAVGAWCVAAGYGPPEGPHEEPAQFSLWKTLVLFFGWGPLALILVISTAAQGLKLLNPSAR